MADKPKKKTNVLVWIVLGLLILALGGFGATNFGGSLSTVATVGDREVTVEEYARAIQNEQRRLAQATGQDLTIQQMQSFGLDRQVMERLLAVAALDEEAAAMGLSVGDAEVATRIRANPAFQGVSGQFDREGYAFALRDAGLNERQFEGEVRTEAARAILEAAIIGGTAPPPGYAETIAAWLSETRDLTIGTVTNDMLDGGATAPTPEALQAFYDENADAFTRPERRRITYAIATPEDVAATVEVTEGEVQALYDRDATRYRLPPRILAERLAFADEAAAQAAREAIEAGERTFADFVADRGLTLQDVDQGTLTRDALDPDLADALFGADGPGLVGPIQTDLGPALYRVNAILDERITPLDDVRAELEQLAAADAARRRIDAAREEIDDLLAGGATLEELDAETIMTLETTEWDADQASGVAGYAAFREAAAALRDGDFPELIDLPDGGLLAMRLDGIEPAAVPPLDDIRVTVEAAWQDQALAERLYALAGRMAERLRAGETFADLGLTPQTLDAVARDADVEGVPDALIGAAFDLPEGEVATLQGDQFQAFVYRVDAVTEADPSDPAFADVARAVEDQTRREVAADVFAAFGQSVREDTGFTVDQAAVQAVQAQLLGGGL
ncbi:peptidylprolyl isomerase [Jannaschia sp. LMIT008]|uniref:peptidylprolyl isomerase n=1 Tax=Jannaschia maritima TaxID=3032585 RepID=UPI002810C3A8|nr:peptidyl-prolyl cis-trans isomerase [Jannaschia sp. LMIT008]